MVKHSALDLQLLPLGSLLGELAAPKALTEGVKEEVSLSWFILVRITCVFTPSVTAIAVTPPSSEGGFGGKPLDRSHQNFPITCRKTIGTFPVLLYNEINRIRNRHAKGEAIPHKKKDNFPYAKGVSRPAEALSRGLISAVSACSSI